MSPIHDETLRVFEVRIKADNRVWCVVNYRDMADDIAARCATDPAAGEAIVLERVFVKCSYCGTAISKTPFMAQGNWHCCDACWPSVEAKSHATRILTMNKNQVELMLKCIRAVRFSQKENFDPITQGGGRAHDFELVEVGKINGVDKRTAASLVALGLLVEDMPSYATEYTNTHVRLPRMDEFDKKTGKPLIEVLQ